MPETKFKEATKLHTFACRHIYGQAQQTQRGPAAYPDLTPPLLTRPFTREKGYGGQRYIAFPCAGSTAGKRHKEPKHTYEICETSQEELTIVGYSSLYRARKAYRPLFVSSHSVTCLLCRLACIVHLEQRLIRELRPLRC